MTYHIPLKPITKKNSQRIITLHGRPCILPSQAYKDYEKAVKQYLKPPPPKPIDYPVEVRCIFRVPDRRKRDLTNLLEAVDDILTACGILADDCYTILVSHDGSRVIYDKENPGTEITITPIASLVQGEVAAEPPEGLSQNTK